MTTMGTVYDSDRLDESPADNPTRVYLIDGSKIGSLVYVGIRHQVESDSGSERGVIIEPSSLERPWEVLRPRSNNRWQPKKTPQYRPKNQRRSKKGACASKKTSSFTEAIRVSVTGVAF